MLIFSHTHSAPSWRQEMSKIGHATHFKELLLQISSECQEIRYMDTLQACDMKSYEKLLNRINGVGVAGQPLWASRRETGNACNFNVHCSECNLQLHCQIPLNPAVNTEPSMNWSKLNCLSSHISLCTCLYCTHTHTHTHTHTQCTQVHTTNTIKTVNG